MFFFFFFSPNRARTVGEQKATRGTSHVNQFHKEECSHPAINSIEQTAIRSEARRSANANIRVKYHDQSRSTCSRCERPRILKCRWNRRLKNSSYATLPNAFNRRGDNSHVTMADHGFPIRRKRQRNNLGRCVKMARRIRPSVASCINLLSMKSRLFLGIHRTKRTSDEISSPNIFASNGGGGSRSWRWFQW